jgi:antitoxin component HigA of HigAB toxin-antitoxin module
VWVIPAVEHATTNERALTIERVKRLAARFKLRPDAFID